jgi:hypothetical protein
MLRIERRAQVLRWIWIRFWNAVKTHLSRASVELSNPPRNPQAASGAELRIQKNRAKGDVIAHRAEATPSRTSDSPRLGRQTAFARTE